MKCIDIDFVRDFKPKDDANDLVDVYVDKEKKADGDLELIKMGIPVIFHGSAGRCSNVIWVRIGSHQSDDGDSIDEDAEANQLKASNCEAVEVNPVEDAPEDALALSKYTGVISAKQRDVPATMPEITGGLHDARADTGKVLVVELNAPGETPDDGNNLPVVDDKKKSRLLKLSISPNGKAVLEMGRGMVIV